MTTNDAPVLLDKSVKHVWIKDGRRKLMSDGGYAYMDANYARRMFGNQRGGKYSLRQEKGEEGGD